MTRTNKTRRSPARGARATRSRGGSGGAGAALIAVATIAAFGLTYIACSAPPEKQELAAGARTPDATPTTRAKPVTPVAPESPPVVAETVTAAAAADVKSEPATTTPVGTEPTPTQPPAAGPAPLSGNLVRNGSFEGSLKYWHRGLDSKLELAKGDAATGRFSLSYLKGGFPWSAPFVLEPETKVTVSASLKAPAGAGKFHVFLVPTCRNAGKEPFKIFWGKSGVGTNVNWTDWKRVSWNLTIPDAKTLDYRTWWDGRTWMVVPTGEKILLDDICVRLGHGVEDAAPHMPVEVTELAVNLPAYHDNCRILTKGFEAELETAVHNPATSARDVTIEWSLVHFDGSTVLRKLGSKSMKLAPRATAKVRHRAALDTNGTVLARATVRDGAGSLLGTSDQPLTTLPFPKRATRPNWNERFGGGVAVGNPLPTMLLGAAQQIGLSWSRWYPHMNWEHCESKGKGNWTWPDEIVKATLDHGIAINAVLFSHGKPEWAFDKSNRLIPKDMLDWGEEDARWDDLSIVTNWDSYVSSIVKRYAGKAIAWEVVNEPQWDNWNPKLYFQLVKRTYRVIKRANPKAVVMTDGCYGVDELHRRFLAMGGAKYMDVFTFHNYSGGEFYSGDGVAGIRQALDLAGGKHIEIWFNEGWTHFPSSEDYPCNTLWATRGPAEVAHGAVRATAETFAAGMDKLIMFQLGYQHQGRSWWDWDGDGTVLYDDCHQPMSIVPTFNVLSHHLGLSTHVKTVRADGAVLHVFQDNRNRRGVIVGWSERPDVSIDVPFTGLVQSDAMGNEKPLPSAGRKTALRLASPREPVYIFGTRRTSGSAFAKALAPFERPIVVLVDGAYQLPTDWLKRGPDGNPYPYKGMPIWTLGRLYPPTPTDVANYRRYPTYEPAHRKWTEHRDSQGGNPAASLGEKLRITVVTEWKDGDKMKPSTLVFHAPEASEYIFEADVVSERWCGGGASWCELYALDRETGKARKVARYELPDRKRVEVRARARLSAGQELALVYGANGWHTGAGLRFDRLVVARADAKLPGKIMKADPNRPAGN